MDEQWIPFNNLVLVEILKKDIEKNESGIILPDKHIGRYVRYRVLDVGPEVDWMEPGDIILGNPTPDDEKVNEEGHKLINSKDLFAKKKI